MGHNVKIIVHNSIESTSGYDLWAILDKIEVLCVGIEQASRWLDARARLKTTSGRLHLSFETKLDHVRCTSSVRVRVRAFVVIFSPFYPPRHKRPATHKKKKLGPTYHEGLYQYMLGYMVDL